MTADERESLVRRQLGIDFEQLRPEQQLAVIDFESEGPLPDEVCVTMGRASRSVLWPLGSGRYRWSFLLGEAGAAENSSGGRQGDLGARKLTGAKSRRV